MTLPSLSPYSNKALISGAHRWEIKYTYLQDIYCIVKPWIQRNKSISQIKMCMCGEWMVYGDDGDNNGESLILLLLFWGDTYLPCFLKLYEENEMLFFFFPLRWVSCTPNSTVGHLSIFTSRLTFSFLRGFGHLPLFISSYFFRALISWNNIASGSNQDNLSIYFTGEKQKYFWLFSPGLGVEYFWVVLEMETGGYMWMRTSRVEVACMSERASESWFNHMTSF